MGSCANRDQLRGNADIVLQRDTVDPRVNPKRRSFHTKKLAGIHEISCMGDKPPWSDRRQKDALLVSTPYTILVSSNRVH